MGSTYHKFLGDWGTVHKWDGARNRVYHLEDNGEVNENWLIGKAEGAENFAIRFYEVQPHCSTKKESHEHDHGVIILQGQGSVEIGESNFPVQQGDVVYIAPNDMHMLRNTGDEVFGFLCIIPAKRLKNSKIVWAESGSSET